MPQSWLELDRANLRHNVTRLRALVAPSRVMAVVKANAYGAGARPIVAGLGRIGVPAAEAPAFVRRVVTTAGVHVPGLLSTLSENPERNPLQVARLRDVHAEVRGVGPLTLTIASSQGIVSLPECYLDAVRAGILLLGVVPGPERADPALVARIAVRPVVSWKARVAYVKVVAGGEQVGCGVRRPLERDLRVATLAVGWADGYPQAIQGTGPSADPELGERCTRIRVND